MQGFNVNRCWILLKEHIKKSQFNLYIEFWPIYNIQIIN